MAIGACRKVGTQTLTASRPSTFSRSFQSATACSIPYFAGELGARAVLEAGERDDLRARVGVVGGEMLLAGPAEADDADAQGRGHANQPRGAIGLPGTARGTSGPGAAHSTALAMTR